MTWAEKLHNAIERRDVTALRRMADEAQRGEDRIFLVLLAQFVDLPSDSTPKKKVA